MNKPDLGGNTMRGECGLDDLAFPPGSEIIRGVLQLTAATGFEMPTRRGHAIRRGGDDADVTQGLAVGRAGDVLARQGERCEKRTLGDPVTLMTEAGDVVGRHNRSSRPSLKPEAIQRSSRSCSLWPRAGPV